MKPAVGRKNSPKRLNGYSTNEFKLQFSTSISEVPFLNRLPDGDAKLWASKNVALNWNQYDPGAVSTWLKTLPNDVKTQVQKHLETQR